MPSYVVTGASRGLGYAFVRHLAIDPSNIVIGLVRNKTTTNERLAKDGIKNVTIIEADITDFVALQKAATETSNLTGGSLDYLINNAALLFGKQDIMDMNDFENDLPSLEKELIDGFTVNVVGVAKTISAFLPLIKQSTIKKVITLSTGLADLDLTNKYSLTLSAPYAVSKGALNILIGKYSAIYSAQGILFLSIAPGIVDTNEGPPPSAEKMEKYGPMIASFAKYCQDINRSFTGPITPQHSVELMMKVVERATVENDGGSFVSQFGDKTWL
ncbi:short chain dehydrogenase [Tricladium varicosporioides]|nr:short chain dehydrogenase [Hymenoscyphus varicosporioides]